VIRIAKLCILAALVAPFLFVTTTIASQIDVMAPVKVGNYTIELSPVARVSERLEEITGAITRSEIRFLRNIVSSIEAEGITSLTDKYFRSQKQAERSL